MDRSKLLILGAVLVSIALLFSLSMQIADPRGLFGLVGKRESTQEEARSDEAAENAENNAVKAGLSLTLLQKTELKASVVEKILVPECPAEAEIEIMVGNRGASDAEKVFVKFGSAVKVIACNNCGLELLKAGQSILAKAKVCREENSPNAITIGSANSNTLTLTLNK